MNEIKKCPECGSEKILSLGEVGTSIGWEPTVGDDGRWHQHDPNHYSMTFRCECMHEMLTVHYAKACWCEGGY